MDFSPSAEMQTRLDRAQQLLCDEVMPLEPALFTDGFNALLPRLQAVRDRVREAGLWAPHMPADDGGSGLSLVDLGLLSEVLGQSPLGHFAFGCQAPDAGNMELLHKYGTDPQKKRFLLPLVAGDVRSCFGLTEPNNPGSNPTRLSTTATRVDGGWKLQGEKWFTSSVDGADFCIVMAVTDADAAVHERATMFIVPTSTDGFVHQRNIPIMGHAGEGYFSHGQVELHDVVVDDDAVLGPVGKGFVLAQERLGPGRIHHCMRWLGICQRAFDMMVDRAATRMLDDTTVLGDKGMVQAFIAESRAEMSAARLLTLQAAWTIDHHGFKAARDDISLIKFHVAKVMQNVVDRAIQVHGALGITDDTPLAFFWGHERGARIYDGPDEVHKESFARRLIRRRQKALAGGEA